MEGQLVAVTPGAPPHRDRFQPTSTSRSHGVDISKGRSTAGWSLVRRFRSYSLKL